MRFMMLIKANDDSEAGKPPSAKLLEAIGRYNDDLVKAGVLLGGEGLLPSAAGALVENHGGKITVTDGPFTGAKELVAGFWTLQVKSRDEAIEWAKQVPLEAGDGPAQLELRQIYELSDFPVGEHESGWREEEEAIRAAPLPPPSAERNEKFILIFRADARSEAGELPSEAELSGMGAVVADMQRQGVLLGAEGLQPSAKGARIYYQGGKRTVIDGPFTEAKELIAGYTIVQVASKAEAIEWSKRGTLTTGDCVNEIRQLL